MTIETGSAEVQLGPQGRLVIPAPLRRTLRLEPGDRLIARVEGGRLILEKRSELVAEIKALYSHATGGESVVDELIAERRAEASKESKA